MEESLWNRAEVHMPWHLSQIPDAYSRPHQDGGWGWGCWVPARHYCLMKRPVIEKVTASTSALNFLQLECLHTCPPLGQIHPSSTFCALLHCSGSTLLVRAHKQCGLCRGLHGVTRSFPIFVWPLFWRSGYKRKRHLEEGEETMLSRKGISGVTRSPPEVVLAA